MKFYLHFLSDNYGKHYIDEPIGYSSVDFQLKQEDGRYARDIAFGGGENPFEFTKWREHELEMLVYYFQTFGYESRVRFGVEFTDGTDNIVGDLDFKEAETDEITYFKCKVVQDSIQALIKKRMDIKVDCFSDRTLDDEPITPLLAENVLIKAKPVVQRSKWTTPTQQLIGTESGLQRFTNFTNNVVESDIKNTLSFIQESYTGAPFGEDFRYIRAVDNLSNVQVRFSNVDIKNVFSPERFGSVAGEGSVGIRVLHGQQLSGATGYWAFPLQTFNNTGIQTFDFPTEFVVNIPFIERGHTLYITLYSAVTSGAGLETQYNSMDIEVIATATSYNTTSKAFRLVDVMQYAVKSTSGQGIDAPRFVIGNQFYDNFLFNGNLLRNLTDKPFYVTMKQIQEGLQEFNCDYEVKPNGDVFFGIFDDFYTPNEIAFINEVQFDTFKKAYNERFALNEFNYKYKSYQSEREKDESNSYDVVHGESQWMFGNKMVENKKDVEIEWVADAFEIEFNRAKTFTVTKNTATDSDDKLFRLDCIKIVDDSEKTFTESALMLHGYDASTNYLSITNDGTFNWQTFGFQVGDQFILNNTPNAGSHIIVEFSPNVLILSRTSPGLSNTQGEFFTNFTYIASLATYKTRTSEGFTLIDNLVEGYNYANLRYTIKRNIINFWSRYLASANLYCKKAIKNTFYKNNPNCETVYQGVQVKEGEDFLPENPILSPIQYNEMVFIMDYDEFVQIQNSVRSMRGFIRVLDNNGTVVKVYPKEMKYISEKKELQVMAEEKYEPDYMKITTQIPGIILINNETRLHEIKWKIIDKKLFIFDENEELMYNGVFWQKVSINGATADTETQLKQWLNLL